MNIGRQALRFLLLILSFFIVGYFVFLFAYEKPYEVRFDLQRGNISYDGPKGEKGKTMEVWGKEANDLVQVITMEENGRLGNLLTEMATLLLLGRRANVTVSLLPQVPYTCAFISGQFICIKHNRYCQNMNLYNIFPTDFCHETTLQVAEKLSPFLYPLPLDVIDQKGFTFICI